MATIDNKDLHQKAQIEATRTLLDQFGRFDTEPEVRERVRKTYDGPLSLAVDYMVWNVTKEDIKVRMAAKDEEVWPSPAVKKKIAPDFSSAVPMSKFTLSGRKAYPEVVKPIYDEINKKYDTEFKPGL